MTATKRILVCSILAIAILFACGLIVCSQVYAGTAKEDVGKLWRGTSIVAGVENRYGASSRLAFRDESPLPYYFGRVAVPLPYRLGVEGSLEKRIDTSRRRSWGAGLALTFGVKKPG